jgi:hypothetical protein
MRRPPETKKRTARTLKGCHKSFAFFSRPSRALRFSYFLPVVCAALRPPVTLWQPSRAPIHPTNPIGSFLRRLPVAAKIAFATAGATGGVPGSPTPPILSVLGTM